MYRLVRLLWLFVVAFLGAACSTSTGNDSGSIVVTVATTGVDLDPDGYTITVGSDVRSVAINATVTFANLDSGIYGVTIGGVAANCSVAQSTTQSAPVVIGPPVEVDFDVTCQTPAEAMTLVAADRDGNVYTLDQATGTETPFATPMADDGAGGTQMLGVISSMVHVPSTDAWWLGMGGNSICPACVYTFDPSGNPSAVLLADLSADLYAIPGLAVDPSTGKVYTTNADSCCSLFELDASTGAVTEVSTTIVDGSSGKGTTFGSDGMLYIAGDDELTRVNVSDFTSEVVANFTYAGFSGLVDPTPTIGSMATRVDGVVFGILKDGGGGGTTTTTYLVTVNLSTGVVSNVGANTNRLDGLAFVPTRLVN